MLRSSLVVSKSTSSDVQTHWKDCRQAGNRLDWLQA